MPSYRLSLLRFGVRRGLTPHLRLPAGEQHSQTARSGADLPGGLFEEVDPILKFVFSPRSLSRRFITCVLLGAAFCGLALPGQAQPPRSTQNRPGTVPLRRYPGVGDLRAVPSDVTARSTEGVKGFKSGATRAQIGGSFGANVAEKTVDITQRNVPDERTPFWSADEQFIYYSSNQDASTATTPQFPNQVSATGRYKLFRVLASPPAVGTNTPTALNNPDDGFDYLFPTVNSNGNQIAFIRSSDGKAITDPTKAWNLYSVTLPANGQVIDTVVGSPNNLRSLTLAPGGPVTFPNGGGANVPFTNVQRPAWIGNADLVFAGQLQGSPNYHLFTVNVQTGVITQITSGPASELNPAVTPDGRTIAFDSNATAFYAAAATPVGYTAGVPRTTINPGAVPTTATGLNPSGKRNIFTLSLLGQNPLQFSGKFAGAIDTNSIQPSWSSQNNNSFSNPTGLNYFLAFASSRQAIFDTADSTRTTITGYTEGTNFDIYYALASTTSGATILAEGAIGTVNGARRLDVTDDAYAFDDQYPTWAPFINALRIGFQSNRTGTLISGGFPNSGLNFTLTPGVNDIYIATVIDTNAPTLLRFDTGTGTGEVIHINPVTDANNPYNPNVSVRTRNDGILPGSTMFFTVRVDDRESGLRPDKAVFLQFKNPNSKYQSLAQGGGGVEHKEYTRGSFTIGQTSPGGVVYLPYSNLGGLNEYGTEYEAQAIGVNTSLIANGAASFSSGTSAGGIGYVSHRLNLNGGQLYEGGQDDFRAFSGINSPPLDGGTYTRTNGSTVTTPKVWLELKPLIQRDGTGNPVLDGNNRPIPVAPADGRGGVLYGATYTVPTEASDWYIDVIVYDNAVNPFDNSPLNVRQQSNFIIYDNVWGYSTAAPVAAAPTDILVVADYALGQKFFGSRFNSTPSQQISNNLLPIRFGAESYLTDVDLAKFVLGGSAAPPSPSGTAQSYGNIGPFDFSPYGGVGGGPNQVLIPNTLGVGSYIDNFLVPFATRVDGKLLPETGRYNIWRILARGPVPTSLLQSYLPQQTTRPADTRLSAAGTPYETAPQAILNTTRMLVWMSPFSGDLFVGPGTITDLQTQNDLTNFVQQGGKLFLTGQDIAFALKGNNQPNNFFDTVVQATFAADDANTNTIRPVANATAYFDSAIRQDPWRNGPNLHPYAYFNGTVIVYSPPSDDPTNTGLLLTAFDTVRFGVNVRGDASLTALALGGVNDVITVRPTTPFAAGPPVVIPSAYPELAYTNAGGPTAMMSSFFGQGRVVYASFGFESLSNNWYIQNNALFNLGRRAELMNNIKSAVRSGTIVGRFVDNNGSPVSGALARAVSGVGTEPNPAEGTAITDANGFYQIVGLRPDAYVIYGYKQGFYTEHSVLSAPMDGGSRSTVNLQLKSANPGALSGAPITTPGAPANNQGGVFRSDGVTPIPGIEVQARLLQPDGQTTITTAISSDGTLVVSGQVLPVGAYRFPSLLIGDYTIISNSPTTLDGAGNVIPNPRWNSLYSTVIVTTAPNAGFAISGTTVVGDRVAILENVTVTINFFLSASPQPVTGRVLNQDTGAGIPGAIVTASVINTTTVIATAVTDANGNYTLATIATPNVPSTGLIPSNTYVITANAGGYSTDPKVSTRPAVTVIVGGDTNTTVRAEDILLKKLPPGSLSGRVSLFNGATTTTTGVGGAIVNLFLVTTINGVDQIATTPTYTATVVEPVLTGTSGYLYNYIIPSVDPGTYVATVTKAGLVGEPAQIAGVVVVTGVETRNVNFTLQPPQIYGAGLQLISVPVDYSALPDPRTIFNLNSPTGDNNGNGVAGEPGDATIYNAFNIADWTGTDYNISPTIPLRLGKGYFVRFGTITPITAPASGTTSTTFTINLTDSWNLIGHPFASQTNASGLAANIDISAPTGATYSYTIPGGATRTNVALAQAVADNALQSVAYSYTGSQGGSSYRQTALIQPYFGYWLRAFVPVQMTLKYPGNAVTRSVRSPLVTKNGKFVTVTRAQQTAIPVRSIESKGVGDWRIQIAAKQGDLVDSDNSVGVAPDATTGFDNRYDNEKPPMMTNAPAVYVGVKGVTATGRSTTLADSVQSSAGRTNKSWDLTVETTGSGEVTLYWPNINRLPRGVEPVLVDVASGRRVSMRTGGAAYRFAPSGRAQRQFRIEVAPPSSQPLELLNLRAAPTGRAANGQSAYRFSFAVTREVDVDAQIQTLSGRTVRRFASRAVAGTEAAVVWDGRDEGGNRLPTGPYVLNLTVRDSNGAQVRQRVIVMSNR